jgi:hypothetical protein
MSLEARHQNQKQKQKQKHSFQNSLLDEFLPENLNIPNLMVSIDQMSQPRFAREIWVAQDLPLKEAQSILKGITKYFSFISFLKTFLVSTRNSITTGRVIKFFQEKKFT